MRMRIQIIIFLLFLLPLWSYCQKKSSNKPLYLIIVSEDYKNSPSLSVFEAFREQKFSVQIVRGASIGTTKDEYRNYIRTLMPGYVLLVGKYGDFPVHVIHYPSEVESYNYYVASSLSGHPDPDIPLGLFLAENETELANIINKTISYESNISSYPKKYYAHAGSNEALPPWPVEFNEEILTEMNDRYFGPNGFDFSIATANDDTSNDVWTDINMINNGIHFMIYHGHGLINKWSFGLGTGGLPQLRNSTYPVILSFACSTGSFSGEVNGNTGDCFAQKMLADEHGAVAFLGAYNKAGKGMNLLMEGIVNGFFNDSIDKRIGDALIHAFANTTNTNTVDQYYPTVSPQERIRSAWQFHLFGDPALLIREDTSSSSVHLFQDDDMINIYPNPANDFLRLELHLEYEQLEVTLFSLDGQMLFQVKNTTEIKISNLKSGYYLAIIKLDKTNFIKKIVKI